VIEPRLEPIDLGFDSLQAFPHCSIARVSHRSIVVRVQTMRTTRQLKIGQILEGFRSGRPAA
jgi:hypothetical protein